MLLVFGAIVIRVAFFTSAPPFLNPDSAGYYVPGRNLVFDDGFDLGLRRTPTYPLFIAAVVSIVGEDLQALVTVQHFLFGPLLVSLTYLLGRLVAGRLAAVVAAVLVGVSGPLLLYEHYVMTEVPFAILLLSLLSASILAARRASLAWAGLAGLLFGALVLCRPSGQILAPIVGGTLLLMPAAWSRRLLALGVLAACALIVVVPWMAYNQHTQGDFAIAGSGRFLLARTLKMDPGSFNFDAPPGVVEDGTRAAARRIVQEEAARKRPGSVAQRLRDELGLSDAEAYPLMQQLRDRGDSESAGVLRDKLARGVRRDHGRRADQRPPRGGARRRRRFRAAGARCASAADILVGCFARTALALDLRSGSIWHPGARPVRVRNRRGGDQAATALAPAAGDVDPGAGGRLGGAGRR